MQIDDNDETYSDPDLRCSSESQYEENRYLKTDTKSAGNDAITCFTSATKPQDTPDPRRRSGFSVATGDTVAKNLFSIDGSSANRSNTKLVKVPPFNVNDVIKKE